MSQIFKCLLRCMKGLILGGRYMIFLHQILRKSLGTLQYRSIFTWTKYFQALCLKCIHNPSYKRLIHTNYCKVYILFLCKCSQFVKLHCPDIYTLSHLADSGIARCAVYFINLWALSYFPCNRMFASAAAHN